AYSAAEEASMRVVIRSVAVALSLALLACNAGPAATQATPNRDAKRRAVASPGPLLDDVEHRTFQFFWDTTNPKNGLVPDRYPTKSFCSIAAVGFGLTAYGIGAERGWVTREQAAERTLLT